MSTARQRRRKKRKLAECQPRACDVRAAMVKDSAVAAMRMRVTAEVDRLAGLLGLTMHVGQWNGEHLWVFAQRGRGILDYWPISGKMYRYAHSVAEYETDIRNVLGIAESIAGDRKAELL